MAYIKKKSLSSASKVEKLPYKGGSATAEKLPYRGSTDAKLTPLKKEPMKKSVSSASSTNQKMMRKSTPLAKSAMSKKATPRSTTTAYREAQSEKFNQKKKY